MKKCTLENCKEISRKNEGECLSVEYINSNTKMLWKCKNNHKWEAIYNDIKCGHWCPFCYGNVKKSIDDCHKLAVLRGGWFLSDKYINSQTRYKWKCGDCYNIWEAKYNKIQQGQWCPKCRYIKSGNANKYNIDNCNKIATSRKGRFLSNKYINAHTKYKWECEFKHTWEALYYTVEQGSWCPYCICQHSKPELEIYELIKTIHPDALNGKKGLLKNKKFELDIYIPSLNKAIEFDGTFWHSEKNPYYNPKRDLKKNRIMSRSRYSTFKN
ncbi:MAG: hypothetical protein KGO96_07315 [Elusimicrobia bacterium]|nr:hypothetical protein [Elusimicrobiota bacterium]